MNRDKKTSYGLYPPVTVCNGVGFDLSWRRIINDLVPGSGSKTILTKVLVCRVRRNIAPPVISRPAGIGIQPGGIKPTRQNPV